MSSIPDSPRTAGVTHSRTLRPPAWLAERWGRPLTTIFSWKCRKKIPGVVQLSPRTWMVDEGEILRFEAERTVHIGAAQ